MTDDTGIAQHRTLRGYVVINQSDPVDVTSYDSFPASDPPSWITTNVGSARGQESVDHDASPTPTAPPTRVADPGDPGPG